MSLIDGEFEDKEDVDFYVNWSKFIWVSFGNQEECFHPEFCNQVIPRTLLPVESEEINLRINFDLATLRLNVEAISEKICTEFLKQLKETCQMNLNSQVNCNYFKKNLEDIGTGLFISKNDVRDEQVVTFHKKLHLLTLFYIDASSFIEYEDPRWQIFYLFTKNDLGDLFLVGFCTSYHFWYFPDKLRPRISQFMIFPPFQKNNVGSYFLYQILKHYRSHENVVDIQVEEPNEVFINIHDSLDVYSVLKSPCEIVRSTDPRKVYKSIYEHSRKSLKLHKKRILIISEILSLMFCKDDEEENNWLLKIINRVKRPYENQLKIAKRVKDPFSQEVREKIIHDSGQALLNIDQLANYAHDSYYEVIKRVKKLDDILK